MRQMAIRLPLILLLLFSSQLLAEEHKWKNPGNNPSLLGYQAIDSLSVPQGVKDGWYQLVADSAYQLVPVTIGITFEEMTFGGKKHGSKFKVWGRTVCAWEKVDTLYAQRYVYVTDSLISATDSTEVRYQYLWELSHFDICDNVAWRLFRRKISLTKLVPQPVVVEPAVEVPFVPRLKKRCPDVETEAFTSTGFDGGYGYASLGGRVNFLPCKPEWLALSGKLMYAGQPPYQPDPKLRSWGKFSYHPMYLSEDYKIGARLTTHLLETEMVYGYIGWHWYEHDYSGHSWETEIILHYQRWQAEQIVVWFPGVDYLWERSRLKYNYWINDGRRYRLGFENVFQGDDDLGNQDFYYSRQGLLWEVFQIFGDGKYWWDGAVHGGHGSFGWYLGAELNFGWKPFHR